MTQPTLDWDKVGRYLAGEASPEEAATVRRWLEEHPSDARVVAALDSATKNPVYYRSTPVDVEAALRRVKTRMHERVPAPWRRYGGFAAAAAILLVAGALLTRRAPSRQPDVARLTYATAIGERKEVVLGDGTRVTLGPATKLVVRGRSAELTGEALFSVIHDSQRPFTVRVGDVVIRDIGTDFSVHGDSGETVRVVVNEGVVQLAYARDSVILARGDVGVAERGGRLAASRGAATDDDFAWTLGRLVFREASMSELVADLRRWYGVELRVTDTALLRRHFTGSFARESPDRVLDVIALALGASVERRGDTTYIRTAPPTK